MGLSSKFKHLIIITIVFVFATTLIGFWVFVFGVGNPFYVITSGSMVPTIDINDIIVVRGKSVFPFGDLKIGDIIVFTAPHGKDSKALVHRIESIIQKPASPKKNETIVITKGDANQAPYIGLDYPIRESNYVGKVVLIIPWDNPVILMLSSKPASYIIVFLITFTVVSLTIYVKGRKGKKNSHSRTNVKGKSL